MVMIHTHEEQVSITLSSSTRLFYVFVCSLQAYIREQIVQTIAVIHKRSTLDGDKSTQCSEDRLFTDIARLIHAGSQSSVSNTCE